MGRGPLITLDTHTWIWWMSDPGKLSRSAAREIQRADRIGIAAICCWELANLAERRRITIAGPPLEWIRNALAETGVELIPLTPAIAVLAARMGIPSLPDPADRIIAATAIEMGATLITKDQRLLDLVAVRTAW